MDKNVLIFNLKIQKCYNIILLVLLPHVFYYTKTKLSLFGHEPAPVITLVLLCWREGCAKKCANEIAHIVEFQWNRREVKQENPILSASMSCINSGAYHLPATVTKPPCMYCSSVKSKPFHCVLKPIPRDLNLKSRPVFCVLANSSALCLLARKPGQ